MWYYSARHDDRSDLALRICHWLRVPVADAHGAALLPEGFVKLQSESRSFFWYRDVLHRSVVDAVREKSLHNADDLASLLVVTNCTAEPLCSLGVCSARIWIERSSQRRIVYSGMCVSHRAKRTVVHSAAQQRIDELEALIRAEHSRRQELEARLAELQRLVFGNQKELSSVERLSV